MSEKVNAILRYVILLFFLLLVIVMTPEGEIFDTENFRTAVYLTLTCIAILLAIGDD